MYRSHGPPDMSESSPDPSSGGPSHGTGLAQDKLFGFKYGPAGKKAQPRRSPAQPIWVWPLVFGAVLVVAIACLYGGGLITTFHLKNSSCSGLNCGIPFGLGKVSTVNGTNGTAGECAAMHYCYEVGIAFASSGMNTSNLQLKLTTSIGTILPLVSWYIDGANVTLNGFLSNPENPSGFWMTNVGSGGVANAITDSTPINSSMTIWIDVSATVNPYGTGAILIATGVGSFSGSLTQALP